jgi:hypothetical protein
VSTFQERDYQAFVPIAPDDSNNGKWARCVTGDASAPVPVIIIGDTELTAFEPTIYNVSVPLANTEVFQALSDDTKQFTIRCRGNAQIQFSFTATESGTKFITIPPGCNYTSGDLQIVTKSIYLQTSKASQVVEIIEWKQ